MLDKANLPDYYHITPDDYLELTSPWFEEECERRGHDPSTIAQELQIQYLQSGSPRFSVDLLQLAAQRIARPLKQIRVIFDHGSMNMVEDIGGDLWIYDTPKPKHSYVIGVDPASGSADVSTRKVKTSKSAVVVLDTTEWPSSVRLVAVYSSRQLDPGWLARLSTHLARTYNGGLMVPEINGPGLALLTSLMGSGHEAPMYVHIIRTRRSRPDEKGHSYRVGWSTDVSSRPLIERAIANFISKTAPFDLRLVEELQTYVWKVSGDHVRGAAAPGTTDDLVISYGLCLNGAEQWNGLREHEVDEEQTIDALLDEYRHGRINLESIYAMFGDKVGSAR